MFTDRKEAGNLLAQKLTDYRNDKNAVVITIPRGGVPIGYTIAEKLNLPLEIILSKKIGHPYNKEYAIGAVTLKNSILSDDISGISTLYIEEETERIRTLLKERLQRYYGNRKPLSLKDKTVIIVDDGVATGNTLISCIELMQLQHPSKIIVALPVAPSSAIKKIKALPNVHDTICLLTPANFHAVGQFYEDFDQVSDEEVIRLLKEAHNNLKIKPLS